MKKLFILIVAMVGATALHAQLPNAGFETWRVSAAGSTNPQAVMAPTSWNGADSLIITYGQIFGAILGIDDTVWKAQIFQDSIYKHTGMYAAKLVTKDQDTLGVFPALLSNSKANVAISLSGLGGITYTGGTATASKPTTVSAWVKYQPANPLDSGFISVQAMARIGTRDSAVGRADIRFGGTDTAFRMVTATLVYEPIIFTVDTVRITFGSSYGLNATENSTAYVDDVSMTSVPQAVIDYYRNDAGITVSPNPAQDVLRFVATTTGQYFGRLFDVTGKEVSSFHFGSSLQVDVADWANGIYYYQVATPDGLTSKGAIQVSK